jgi:hypothetical protein
VFGFGSASSTAVFGGESPKVSPKSDFLMARIALPKYIGTRLTEVGRKEFTIKRFVKA